MPFLSSQAASYGFGRAKQPPPASRSPSGTYRINIVGDASISTLISGLNTAKTALGYAAVTLTFTNTLITSSYTGSNLTLANFEAVLIYTNGGLTFNASLGTNLNAYIASGGPVVFGMFMWGNVAALTNFTYTNSPYAFRGSQSSQTATMTKTVVHPITTPINTSVAGSTFCTPTVVVQTSATSIATFPDGTSMVAYQNSPRRVAVNLYPLTNTAPSNQLFLTSLLWAVGFLN